MCPQKTQQIQIIVNNEFLFQIPQYYEKDYQMFFSINIMAKNERIIAQDLAEIKNAIQIQDVDHLSELCKILAKEIKKYPVKLDVINRLEQVSLYSKTFSSTDSNTEKIKEIDDLIFILISNR